MAARKKPELSARHAELVWATSVWARTREPRIADLADVITARLASEQPREPLAASKKQADLATWKAREQDHDVADFPALVVAARGGQQDDVIRQVKALAKWTDPRFGAGLLAMLEKPPYAGVASRGMLGAIFDAIVDAGDRRLPSACSELASRYL
ncbi:MAG TPA: hypothetical protein VGC41_06720, partial [Kofleriaceae bacterium]